MNPADCPLMAGTPGTPGRCAWCDGELTGQPTKWCSDDCVEEWRAQHWWNTARKAALLRDHYACVRCGFISWWDATPVLRLEPDDREAAARSGASLEDWAIAVGLITADDALWGSVGNWNQVHTRTARATEQLPESIRQLVESERPTVPFNDPNRRLRPTRHELEVNHIEPRRGAGYQSGCHHHLDGLETLCRSCHTDETRRQRLGLPSWREDPRPIEIMQGGRAHKRNWNSPTD